MKKTNWVFVLLAVVAILFACSDSNSVAEYSIPEYRNEAALPDSCEKEVAKVKDAYFACFENKWVEVTDSLVVETLQEDLDEEKVKKLLEDLLVESSSAVANESSSKSSESRDEDLESSESEEPESSSSEECTGRRCKKKSSSSSKKEDKEYYYDEPLPSSSSKEASSSSVTSSSSSKMTSSNSVTSSSSSKMTSSNSVMSSSSSKVQSSSSKWEITSADCTGKVYTSGNHNLSVTVDGKKRTFIMHVPSAYNGDKPVPLVVDYHPIMGSGSNQLNGTTYKAVTDPEGVISLYPDGTKSANPQKMGPGWNVGPCCSDDDDEKFTREMIRFVEEKVCIDRTRIYATGFSMGGGMANHVACFMSDVFAAVAPAAMDLNKTNSAKCNTERPISIIMFRGTADNVCRYEGGDSGFNDGLNFLGAEGNFRFWAEKNGCEGSPSKNSDNCDEYSKCKDGTKVVLCTKQNGGHEQGNGNVGWPFLKQFTMPITD